MPPQHPSRLWPLASPCLRPPAGRNGLFAGRRRPFLPLLLLLLLVFGCGHREVRASAEEAVPSGTELAAAFGKKQSPAQTREAGLIRLAAMGDIMLGTDNMLPADDARGAFAAVKPFLQGRDIIFGNLEGPLTDRGRPSKVVVEGRSYVFRMPPRYVDRLKDAGFTMVSVANNHVYDFGPEGYAQSSSVLDAAGIGRTGAPGQVSVQQVGPTRVAFIAVSPNDGCQHLRDVAGLVALVRREAAKADTLVVVSVHGGGEGAAYMHVPQGTETFLGENRGNLRSLARQVIDAGACLVIGHGPHVPRGAELYKGRLIAYSLGNFATGRGISVKGANGLAPLLLVDLDRRGYPVGGKVVSFRQAPDRHPFVDPQNEAARLMGRLSREDFAAPGLDESGKVVTPTR